MLLNINSHSKSHNALFFFPQKLGFKAFNSYICEDYCQNRDKRKMENKTLPSKSDTPESSDTTDTNDDKEVNDDKGADTADGEKSGEQDSADTPPPFNGVK